MSTPIALITGGGSGIGLAVAEHLIQFHGYKVAIADIVKERATEQAARLGSDHCLALHADVTDYDSQAKAFVQTFEWGGNRLDLFFANAGIGDLDSLYKDLEIDESTGLPKPLNIRCVEVNLLAVMQGIHLARHFFSEKNSKPGGRIVATSSSLGLYPNHAIPQYSASKHALVGLIRSLAPVYAKDNITINTLNPALIETNIMPAEVLVKWDRSGLTPMDRALQAFDMILGDGKLTGQTIELARDGLFFKRQPEYAMENTRWMCERHALWEEVAEPLMPRPPGENAVFEYQAPEGVIR
ncbi:hypothetical protein M409DRAFT_65664 [Zasmidium cellare ATCC 36951]|uniref:15-hydroxyprostaglandin dehydrogenase n=1 Tax=Zasmidium cellare ATCC 36951 TaxID=1080233 RepID=A0A6A6CM89_ZASCE|nr:uncharacterized protein M409DRAFT_65664 [Zasmidium cellare ATCC 36951]KAF2168161.1 hypothetical protein M409DRAFT_65664 [Zasmidium cellare ATCC 36951]